MLYLNSIKNSNIRGKKISHINMLYNTPELRWTARATASVFTPKIRYMVANIYSAVESASPQNLFGTCNENRSSALEFDTAGN